MAGETVKTQAVCLSVAPWSRTSHVVTWLTPSGRVGTVVKGAVRPKSAFLGQYDLNYTCEVVYYARARGALHVLRECAPVARRDALRDDYAALALAGYFRLLSDRFAPPGPDCADWYAALSETLDGLERGGASVEAMLRAELRHLHLLGLEPEIEAAAGSFTLRGERKIPLSSDVARYIRALGRFPCGRASGPQGAPLALDAARVLGVYYNFHVDGVSDVRRAVLRLIHNKARRT